MMNRWKQIAILGILFTMSCSQGTETGQNLPAVVPSQTGADSIRILALGDSLTAGFGVDEEDAYPAQLQAKLQADGYDVVVINGGISGETSSGALARLEWMLGTQPNIVIVETGGNDALRGIDLDLTAENLDQIVSELTNAGIIVVVAGMQIIQNLGPEYAETYAAIYPDVAAQFDAVLIPFFLEGVAADPLLNQADFIHPNAAGYITLVDNIYPYVLDAIKRLK